MKTPPNKVAEFALDILIAAGADPEQAEITSAALVWNDLAGRTTQGLWRLPTLAQRLDSGGTNGACKPTCVAAAPSMELFAGDSCDGYYAGHLAMSRAIELARDTGLGAAGVNGSNHFGSGAYFVELACRANMLGLAFSNSFPKQAPHGGHERVFGTNPVAFGAPRRDERSILVDFATAASAGSTLRKNAERGEPLPEGIVEDHDGKPITDPQRFAEGVLMSFGGAKGYGLALMVEILCGVLTDAAMSHQIRSFFEHPKESGNLGHVFIALDISRWMPLARYFERIETLATMVLAAGEDVRLPGEMRWHHWRKNSAEGLEYDETTQQALQELAARYQIAVPWR